MGTRKLRMTAALWAVAALGFVACEKSETGGTGALLDEVSKADQFAIDVLGSYYLWNEEIERDLKHLNPDTCRFPMEVVKNIRYYDYSAGREIDRWTVLTDDLQSLVNSIQGREVAYGYYLQAGRISNAPGCYFLVVTYVVKDSPADKAGLKRGDVILTLDGKTITKENIYDSYNTASVTLGLSTLVDGQISTLVHDVALTAEEIYEDPILVAKTFDVSGKTVGYLAYTSFDLKSSLRLPELFRQFKSKGVDELILDLRYNGGGYAFTETLLASMIAPEAQVESGDVFQTEVYNSILTEQLRKAGEDANTYFSTIHRLESGAGELVIDVSDANLGIDKVYAIVSGGTASASEGLIVGLDPYMDIELIGKQTHGKYCAGVLLSPKDIYNNKYDYSLIKGWGMYVMISMFADRDGRNASIPDGLSVDVEAEDDPLDGYQLGDENETMLRAALQLAGKSYPQAASQTRAYSKSIKLVPLDHGAPRGILIKTDVPPFR